MSRGITPPDWIIKEFFMPVCSDFLSKSRTVHSSKIEWILTVERNIIWRHTKIAAQTRWLLLPILYRMHYFPGVYLTCIYKEGLLTKCSATLKTEVSITYFSYYIHLHTFILIFCYKPCVGILVENDTKYIYLIKNEINKIATRLYY